MTTTETLLAGYTAYTAPAELQREALAGDRVRNAGSSISITVTITWTWTWTWSGGD